MDIERLAHKLEPIIPDKIYRWMTAREYAAPDVKAIIEKQILYTAHQLLGDYDVKLLLSLPPKKLIAGMFNLGTVIYDNEKWPAGISKTELMQNMAIFGRSGAGKTNVSFHLLEQLIEQKVPFLFLDWKRTARHLLPLIRKKIRVYTPGRELSPFPFNPFIVPLGLEPNVYINMVVDLMAESFTLGDGARSILQKAIIACYGKGSNAPTISDIIEEVDKQPDKERVRSWKITAIRVLESMSFSRLSGGDSKSQEAFARSLINENTFVELDGLSQGGKKFLVPLLCLWLYYVELSAQNREQLHLVIFIEEAHHVLYRHETRNKESIMNMLLRQCREIGIGIIVIDQHPHLISSAALGNTYTSICMNLKEPSDINHAAALSLVDETDKRHFSMLPVGQGVVKLQDRWRQPFLVQFPHVHVNKGCVTDAILKRYMASTQTEFMQKLREPGNDTTSSNILFEMGTLNEDELAFIEDVLMHPDEGVNDRYHRLGFYFNKGCRIKDKLLKLGWLESLTVPVGNSRKLVLSVTPHGKKALGLDSGEMKAYGSLVHEYWKRYYAQLFAGKGYIVTLEAPRRGGRVDILATKGNEKIGIEIETGKSDAVRNVKNGLLEGFTKLFVVATSETIYEKLMRLFVQQGLLIEERVEMELAIT